MLPARPPDGWWTGHPRYRRYVLFASTGLAIAAVDLLLLAALASLGSGHAAWASFQARLASTPGLAVSALLLVALFFFAVRWMRVGAKIPAVRLGILPAPNVTLVLVMQMLGLVSMFAGLVVLLSGAIGI
jgi:fumarate reductase subunit C